MKRTSYQLAGDIEKCIEEISGNVTDKRVTRICKKYNLNENHIRKIAGWKQI